MKPEEQRIAIAKTCGWQFIPEYHHGEDQPPEFTTVTPDGKHLCGYYPDYLNDLNAMHEAEKILTNDQRDDYFDRLLWVGPPLFSTAAQRAEAFLRTLNLWRDDN